MLQTKIWKNLKKKNQQEQSVSLCRCKISFLFPPQTAACPLKSTKICQAFFLNKTLYIFNKSVKFFLMPRHLFLILPN